MAQTAQIRQIDRPENEAQRVFQLQREAYRQHPTLAWTNAGSACARSSGSLARCKENTWIA